MPDKNGTKKSEWPVTPVKLSPEQRENGERVAIALGFTYGGRGNLSELFRWVSEWDEGQVRAMEEVITLENQNR